MTSESQIASQLPLSKHGMQDHAQPVGQAFWLGGAHVILISCTAAAHPFVQRCCLALGIASQSTCGEKSCIPVNRCMQSRLCMQCLACTTCRLMELIEEACDPGIFGQQFFYSYGTDITLTQQRFTSLSESSSGEQKPQWARADKRFFWNRHLTQSLTGICCCEIVELLIGVAFASCKVQISPLLAHLPPMC